MDIAKAERFIYHEPMTDTIYISKDIQRLLDSVDHKLISLCKAVVNTESGPILFDMDEAYSGDPIIMRRFMHYSSYMGYYHAKKIIEL